ncbi:MAG: hypothetical protein ACRDHW_22500 [Ktedonobacteraceae bacterium]
MPHQRKKRSRQDSASDTQQPALVPGRAKDHPFCAYMGADGAICDVKENLLEVFGLQGPPLLVFLACPAHQEEVRQQALDFMRRCQVAPQTMLLSHHGQLVQVQVTGVPKKNEC